MESDQVLRRHASLPVWCLSRANLRLADVQLRPLAEYPATVSCDGRHYTSDLLGLFELLNVRYMREEAECRETVRATLSWLLRAWLRASPREATLGNLFACLRQLGRPDILQRLDTRLFVEYYHVYIGYHRTDAAKARTLMDQLARLEPGWLMLDCQLVSAEEFPPTDVLQRCFSSVVLVSQAYLTENSRAANNDYMRLLIQEKCRNYPAFFITTDSNAAMNLPSGMRLFPILSWSLLPVTRGFLDQVRRCVKHKARTVGQSHAM